jgi:hypothetical protein
VHVWNFPPETTTEDIKTLIIIIIIIIIIFIFTVGKKSLHGCVKENLHTVVIANIAIRKIKKTTKNTVSVDYSTGNTIQNKNYYNKRSI